MDTCFVYMTDAVLERCKRHPYRLDVVITNRRYSGVSLVSTTPWDAHFVKPEDKPVF